jgi:hypothetical protein
VNGSVSFAEKHIAGRHDWDLLGIHSRSSETLKKNLRRQPKVVLCTPVIGLHASYRLQHIVKQ